MNGKLGAPECPEWRLFVVGLLAVDTVALALALTMAYQARFVWQVLPFQEYADPGVYLRLGLVLIPLWIGLSWVHSLYDAHLLLGGVKEYARVVNVCTYAVLALVVVSFVERQEGQVSRGWIILVWVISILCVGSLRFAARRVVYALRRRGLFIRRAIVAGADEQGISLASHLSPAESTGVRIMGFVHDYLAPGSVLPGGFRVLGEPADLEALARQNGADLVIVVPGALSWESQQEVMRVAADGNAAFECRLLPGIYDVVASGVHIDGRGPVPLLTLNRMRIMGFDRVLKGILDYGGSAVLLMLALPIFILLAVLSIRKGQGTVHAREFVGAQGKPFEALGFGNWWNGEIPTNGDSLERFLYVRRMYRLPGLLNVLKGEMSLVGPRRVTTEELERQTKWRHSLLSVKPGLTGPWLLAGGERLTLEESLRLDLHYVRNYSIWLDLQILFQTTKMLLKGLAAPSAEKCVPANIAYRQES